MPSERVVCRNCDQPFEAEAIYYPTPTGARAIVASGTCPYCGMSFYSGRFGCRPIPVIEWKEEAADEH